MVRDTGGAAAWYGEARPLLRELGDRGALVATLTVIGQLVLAPGDGGSARAALEASSALQVFGWSASASAV